MNGSAAWICWSDQDAWLDVTVFILNAQVILLWKRFIWLTCVSSTGHGKVLHQAWSTWQGIWHHACEFGVHEAQVKHVITDLCKCTFAVRAYLHSTKQACMCVCTCVLTYLLVRKYVCAYVPMYNCVSMHALHTMCVIYGSVHMYTAKSRDTRTMLPRGYMHPESYTMSVYTTTECMMHAYLQRA
jgi:hypothetical protein